MPEELEKKLAMEARKKGFTGERKNAYIYGTLRKTGWKPSREKTNLNQVAMARRASKKA